MVSGMSGTTRPTELDPGGAWIDKTDDPTSWVYKVWTGVDDIEVFTIDLVNGASSVALAVDSFIVRKVSADTVGAAMELVKRRIATNGQVLSGDVVGEVRLIGRDDVAGNPVVAKIIYEAAENMTATAFGGTLTFYSTPAAQAALVAHMRFIEGVVETLVPHKINSQILVSQNVATAATIAQLSGAKAVVEMTGATATEIQGINSGHASKVVAIHNRSSANVTAKNQDAGAAAADRMLLPEGKDLVLLPQDSVTLFYCTTDTRWKILYASSRFTGFETDTILASVGEWVAPATVTKARLVARAKSSSFPVDPTLSSTPHIIDAGKSLYSWGENFAGNAGVGDIIPRSSPVAVLGGLKFAKVGGNIGVGSGNGRFGLSESGALYTWGVNLNGELGLGDVIPRSSPVVVAGGTRYASVVAGGVHTSGLLANGDLYAWGLNAFGQLGLGDVVPRSSPVAVLGGLKFREIYASQWNSFALALDGTLYAWGLNAFGQLGLGDVTPRSSPVAVLGGLKFKSIKSYDATTLGLTEDNDLYAWGVNTSGVLGVGNVISRSSPVAVLGGLKFRDFFIDGINAFGITTAGVAYAWGVNLNGQLGLGDVVPRSSPVAVLGGLKFRAINPCAVNVVGLTEDGAAYAWGVNINGELGLGDVIPRSSPVAVLGGLSFQEIFSTYGNFGGASRFGLTWDGKMYSWGDNTSGVLGVGDVVPRSSPVAVLGGLSLKTQDDADITLDIPIVGGNTYSLKLGAGPCFFGNKPIGNNIQSVEITYIE